MCDKIPCIVNIWYFVSDIKHISKTICCCQRGDASRRQYIVAGHLFIKCKFILSFTDKIKYPTNR